MLSVFFLRFFKIVLLSALLSATLVNSTWNSMIVNAFSSVFLDVGVLVVLVLYLIHYLDSKLRMGLKDLSVYGDYKQILICTLLGALPGCGGAIFVVNQFLQGNISFAALTASFVSTMGDAVFLLLSKKPLLGLLIVVSIGVLGLVTGCIIFLIHGRDFVRSKTPIKITRTDRENCLDCSRNSEKKHIISVNYFEQMVEYVWFILCGLAILFLVSNWLSISISDNQEHWVKVIGVAGTIVSLLIWLMHDIPLSSLPAGMTCEKHGMLYDCVFIIFWVLVSVIFYGFLTEIMRVDIFSIFKSNLYWLPLFGVLVGLIPGCGPQIVIMTMYLNGLLPLSAQIANAISTDGDALLPAIAVDYRATVFATIYSTIPAIIVGYAYMFLVEL